MIDLVTLVEAELNHEKVRLQKRSSFSSAPSSNFYQKKSHAPRQILNLGKHMKSMHFSDDIVFLLTLVIFLFFLTRIKAFIFQFPPPKKKIAHSRHFSIFV